MDTARSSKWGSSVNAAAASAAAATPADQKKQVIMVPRCRGNHLHPTDESGGQREDMQGEDQRRKQQQQEAETVPEQEEHPAETKQQQQLAQRYHPQQEPCQSPHCFQQRRQFQQQCLPRQQQHWQQQPRESSQQQQRKEGRHWYQEQHGGSGGEKKEEENEQQQQLGSDRHQREASYPDSLSSEAAVSLVGSAVLSKERRDSFQTAALHAAPAFSHNLLSPSTFRFASQPAPAPPLSPSGASSADGDATLAAPAASQTSPAVAAAAARVCYSPLRYPFAFTASPRALSLAASLPPAAAPASPAPTAAASPPAASAVASAAAADSGAGVTASDSSETVRGVSFVGGGGTAAAAACPASSFLTSVPFSTSFSTKKKMKKRPAGDEGGDSSAAAWEAEKDEPQQQQRCVSVLVGAAACWFYGVSLLTLQTPLTAAAFCTAQQQRAFRMQLLLLPLLRVAVALYLLLAFFEEPASPATTGASAATRQKPLPPLFPAPRGVQTPEGDAPPPQVHAFTPAVDSLSAAEKLLLLPSSQVPPASPLAAAAAAGAAAAARAALLQTTRVRVGPPAGAAATAAAARRPGAAQELPRWSLAGTVAEAGGPPQYVSLSPTIFFCRPYFCMASPPGASHKLIRIGASLLQPPLVGVRPSSAAAAAAAKLLLQGEAAAPLEGRRRKRKKISSSSYLPGRRLSAAAGVLPAVFLSSSDERDAAAATARAAADVGTTQQQQQQRRGSSRSCRSILRRSLGQGRHAYVAGHASLLESRRGAPLAAVCGWQLQQNDLEGYLGEEAQPLLLQQSGSANRRTHAVRNTMARASRTTKVDSPAVAASSTVGQRSAATAAAGPPGAEPSTREPLAAESYAAAAGLPPLGPATTESSAGVAAAFDESVSSLPLATLCSAAAPHDTAAPAAVALGGFSADTAGSVGATLEPDSAPVAAAAGAAAAVPFASGADAAPPAACGGLMAGTAAEVLPSPAVDLYQERAWAVLDAPRKPAGHVQPQQPLNNGGRAASGAAAQQQQHQPQQKTLPGLSPWWERLLHLVAAVGCLLLFLATALLESTYRGCCLPSFVGWLRSSCGRSSGGGRSNRSDSSNRRYGDPTNGSSSSASDNTLIQSSSSGRADHRSSNNGSSPNASAAKPTMARGLCAQEKQQPISAAAAAPGDEIVTGIAVLPAQLLLLLVGCAVSLADVLVAGTLLLQLPPAACSGPPVGKSAGSCLSAAVAAAAEKTHSRAAAAFLSLYKPLFVFRLARPLLLALLCHPVLMMLLRIVRTLPKVKTIVMAAFLSVLLFDWLGVILFAGTGSHDEFHSFGRGCVSLLLVVTTVRLPQVLLQGYAVHEVAVLFIVLFYLLTAVLLGLFAAAFYTAYRDADTKDRRWHMLLALRYVRSAFDLLVRAEQEEQQQQLLLLQLEQRERGKHQLQPQQQQPPAQQQQERQQQRDDQDQDQKSQLQQPRQQQLLLLQERRELLQEKEGDICSISRRTWLQFYVAYISLPDALQRFPSSSLFDGDLEEQEVLGTKDEQRHAAEKDVDSAAYEPLLGPSPVVVFQQQQQQVRRCAQQQHMNMEQQELREAEHNSRAPSSIRLFARAAGPLCFLGATASGQRGCSVAAEAEGQALLPPAAAAVHKHSPSTTARVNVGTAAAAEVTAAEAAEHHKSSYAAEVERNSTGAPILVQGGGRVVETAAAPDSSCCWGLAEAALYDVEHYVGRGSDNSSSSVAVVGTACECEEQSVFTDESSSSSIVLGSAGRRRRPPLLQDFLLRPRLPRESSLRDEQQQLQQGQCLQQQQQHEEKHKEEHQQQQLPEREDEAQIRQPFSPEIPQDRQCMPQRPLQDEAAATNGQRSRQVTSSSNRCRRRSASDNLMVDETGRWCGGAANMSALSVVASPGRSSSSAALFTGRMRSAVEGEEIFQLLDRQQKDRLCWRDFAALVPTLAQYKGEKKREEEERWNSRNSGDPVAVRRRRLNTAADVCVAVSLLLTYMQTRKFIKTASNLTGGDIETSPVDLAEGMPASCFGSVAGIYWLQNALSFVYLIAVVVRVSAAASLKRYTGLSLRERFDMLMGVAVMTLEAACLWAGSASAFHPACTTETFDDLSRSLAFVRVLRGVRLCFRVSALRKMITSLVAAVAALNTVLLLLIVVFCTYATLGMELFGGIIKCDMEHLPPKDPYVEDPTDWGVLNFNHFFASLVTLFLLTVNGWDDSLKALVKQTSVFSCGAYFVSFYLLTDTIILNLLVALVLEAYDQIVSTTSHKRLKARSSEKLSDARPAGLARFCRSCMLWWPATYTTCEKRRCAA